jgi:hypothetical protein
MTKYIGLWAGMLGALSLLTAQATTINVALDKNVTLSGVFGSTSVAEATLTDGLFLTEQTQWNVGSVWWDENSQPSVGNSLIINLGGTCTINSFTAQVDNNDTYRLEYWDLTSSSWQTAWDIPSVGGWGLMTRSQELEKAITTTDLRFYATGGDMLYSACEIQALGNTVPEGGCTLVLLGGALSMVGWFGSKNR